MLLAEVTEAQSYGWYGKLTESYIAQVAAAIGSWS